MTLKKRLLRRQKMREKRITKQILEFTPSKRRQGKRPQKQSRSLK